MCITTDGSKIFASIGLLIYAGLFVFILLYEKKTYVMNGPVTPREFDRIYEFYENRDEHSGKLVVNSGGGNAFAAIAIGKYVREKGLDVEIEELCVSSCANYIFTAANKKYLKRDSLIVYHGGALQRNLNKQADDAKENKFTNHMGEASFTRVEHGYSKRILEYLELKEGFCTKPDPCLSTFRELEEEFFQSIDVDRKITVYGQLGDYEEKYLEMDHWGFYYSLDDMRAMGISNIVLEDGKWEPLYNKDREIRDKFYFVKL